jgi:hypothetical protein
LKEQRTIGDFNTSQRMTAPGEAGAEILGNRIVIVRDKPRQDIVREGVIEQERKVQRMRLCSADYWTMGRFLGRFRQNISCKTGLLSLATIIAKEKGITIDRSAKRSKECLICWFCENAKDVMDISKLRRWLNACNFKELPERKCREEKRSEYPGLDNSDLGSWITSDFWSWMCLPDQFWGEEHE